MGLRVVEGCGFGKLEIRKCWNAGVVAFLLLLEIYTILCMVSPVVHLRLLEEMRSLDVWGAGGEPNVQ